MNKSSRTNWISNSFVINPSGITVPLTMYSPAEFCLGDDMYVVFKFVVPSLSPSQTLELGFDLNNDVFTALSPDMEYTYFHADAGREVELIFHLNVHDVSTLTGPLSSNFRRDYCLYKWKSYS